MFMNFQNVSLSQSQKIFLGHYTSGRPIFVISEVHVIPTRECIADPGIMLNGVKFGFSEPLVGKIWLFERSPRSSGPQGVVAWLSAVMVAFMHNEGHGIEIGGVTIEMRVPCCS